MFAKRRERGRGKKTGGTNKLRETVWMWGDEHSRSTGIRCDRRGGTGVNGP